MKKTVILIAALLLHAAAAIAQTAYEPRFFTQYWEAGALDPARNRQWDAPAIYEDRLEYIPVDPAYVLYISEGDRSNSADYFQIHPQYNPDGTLTIKPIRKGHTVILFVDLGRTLPGTLEFEANPSAGVDIGFETGEAMQPKQKYTANVSPDGAKKKFRPQINHAGWAGMRYVWIRFENVAEPFTLYGLNGIYQVRPSRYIGNFECNDGMLNRIWEMCAYSAHAIMGQPDGNDPAPQSILQTLCMDRVDRHPWAGDSRVIQKAVEYVFGEYELIRRANERFVPVGVRPVPVQQTVIPYTLDWALAETDYFWVSGDSDYFVKRLDDILSMTKDFDPYLNPKKGWYFVDWDERVAEVAVQEKAAFFAKYIQVCREAAEVALILGNRAAADKLTAKADEYTAKWKESNPDWYEKYDIHALTNLVRGKMLEGDDLRRVYEKVYADRAQRCTGTPYFGFYILQALTQIGKQDKALEMIRDYWGTMIQAGATSTWEEWHPTIQHSVGALPPQFPRMAWSGLSLIQPSGAGPAQWLLSEIIGIQPESPGFRDVRIEPNMVDLQWAKGTAATPLGAVSAEWKTDGKTTELQFDAPRACRSVTVVLPQGKKYLIDSRKVTPDRVANGKAWFTMQASSKKITVLN
ncbi:MAG: hypothetical protein LBJ47_01735 [Tannerella sp.]|jgi:hypothetical protein|nr:hypothetical protein [Tannerella sp.]